MTIWKHPTDLETLNKKSQNTMMEHLGIVFTELGDDFLSATMPVDNRTHQPYGIMHGGASCVLAETVGSTAGLLCLDVSAQFCLGLSLETHHIRPVKTGFVIGTAKPRQLGSTIHIWDIDIVDNHGHPISANRLTLIIRNRKSHQAPLSEG